MHKGVLNKQGKFGVKILWRYTDMVIFVLRCFILTHPVHARKFATGQYAVRSPKTVCVTSVHYLVKS